MLVTNKCVKKTSVTNLKSDENPACSKFEYRSLIRFFTLKGSLLTKIHKNSANLYSNLFLPLSLAIDWPQKFAFEGNQ